MRRWLIILTFFISTVATLHAANVNVTINGEISIDSGDANAFFVGRSVTGTAITEENGSITVTIAGVGSDPIVSGEKFDFGPLAAGKYTLTASATGYEDTTKTVWVIDVASVEVTGTDDKGQERTAISAPASNGASEVTLRYDAPVEGLPLGATCTVRATFVPNFASLTSSELSDMLKYVAIAISGDIAVPNSGGIREGSKLVIKDVKLTPRGGAASEKTSSGVAQFTVVAGVGRDLQRNGSEGISGAVSTKDMRIRITCGSCSGTSCRAGSVETSNGCFQMSALLGWQGGIDARAGAIAEMPSPALTKLSGLKLSGVEGIGVKKENDVVRQTLSITALADFVQINDYKYEIRFYHRSVIGQPDANGIYSPSGPPYQKVTVENPDADPAIERCESSGS